MNQIINFKRLMNFTGRNGYFKQSGIEIMTATHDNKVMLTPLNSRGELARCDMEIPLEQLSLVIDALKKAEKILLTEKNKS